MCAVEGCDNKNYKDTPCCWRHRGQVKNLILAPVEEILAPVEEIVAPVEEIVAPVEEDIVAPVEEEIVAQVEEEIVALVGEIVAKVEEIVAPVEEEIVAQVEEEIVAPVQQELDELENHFKLTMKKLRAKYSVYDINGYPVCDDKGRTTISNKGKKLMGVVKAAYLGKKEELLEQLQKNETLFTDSNIQENTMSPHDTFNHTSDRTSIDTIAEINQDKIKYFKEQCFILGNVNLTFSDQGKKKATNWCKWKDLIKSEKITGNNFLIRTGIKSFITVFDVDIKPSCNGVQNLVEAGIDFDEYLEDCIKIKTQSGGFHYIFKYDQRFTTGANCFGIQGFDIRNDDAVIFAGERYDIASVGKNFDCPSCLDDIYDLLSQHRDKILKQQLIEEEEDVKQRYSVFPKMLISTSKVDLNLYQGDIKYELEDPVDKYYELLNLLDDKYFNQFDLWVKPIYAMRNEIDTGLDETIAYNTCNRLLQARSTSYNKTEFDRIWNLKMKDTNKRFKIGSIINILKQHAADAYEAWNAKWNPKKIKVKSDKQLVKEAEAERDQLHQEMMDEFVDECKKLHRELIREENNLELNDMLMEDTIYTVKDIALLIKQTCVRVENNGSTLYFVKTNHERKFERIYIDTVRFEPKSVNDLKHEICIKYKNDMFSKELLDLINAARTTLNYKKIACDPYGALEEDCAIKRKNFNLFSGWVHKYDPEFIVDQQIVDVWLNHIRKVICNDNEAIYKHLMCYFKHILINPMKKTGLVIIVKGEHGSGKNSTFDIFNRYVVGPHVSLTTSRMDMITGRFNSLRQGLICCCLDEAVDNKDRTAMNQFKNLITSAETQIERKGFDPITLPDYTNYVVISNNDFASFIEETDRRALCLETSSCYRKNKEYFCNYYNTLDNLEAGKHIFHYLINSVEMPNNWNAQETPSTEYKQELKRMQASTPVKYLLHRYDAIEDKDPDEEIVISCSDLWIAYVEHCQLHRFNIVSSAAFYKIVGKFLPSQLRLICEKQTKCKVYSRNILKEALTNYL